MDKFKSKLKSLYDYNHNNFSEVMDAIRVSDIKRWQDLYAECIVNGIKYIPS